MSVAIGISVVGYSFLPGTSKHPSSSDMADASCISPPDAS